MATGDRGVARRAPVLRSSTATESGKPGLPRHSFATVGGFGVVPLGFATDALPCGRGASLCRFGLSLDQRSKSLQ